MSSKKINRVNSLLASCFSIFSLALSNCGIKTEQEQRVDIPVTFLGSSNQSLLKNKNTAFYLNNALGITSYTITNSGCTTTSTNTAYPSTGNVSFVLGDTGCKSKLTALVIEGLTLTITSDFPGPLAPNQTAHFEHTGTGREFLIRFIEDTRKIDSPKTIAVDAQGVDEIIYEISEAYDSNDGTLDPAP